MATLHLQFFSSLRTIINSIEGPRKHPTNWAPQLLRPALHIVLRLSAMSLIGCIGVPAKKYESNEVLPKFCDVCPNHNFLAHYG